MRAIAIAAVLFAACATPNSITCPDGRICPIGTACAETTVEGLLCVDPNDLVACVGVDDGMPCIDATHRCYEHLCLPGGCGNHHTDTGEFCDDGNSISGDGCAADCSSDEACGNAIRDRGETCDDADTYASDGCSSTCELEIPRVTQNVVIASSAFTDASTVYDAGRDRFIVFDTNSFVSEYDGHNWWPLRPEIAPRHRVGGRFAYDARRHVSIHFGGADPALADALADTWAWNGVAWSPLDPATSPGGRRDHAMAYDPKRARVVLFGGSSTSNGVDTLDDTWIFDGENWSELGMASRPPPRRNAAMIYDPIHDVMVLVGGTGQTVLDDVWTLDDTGWHPAPALPQPRTELALTFDPARRAILAIGGTTTPAGTALGAIDAFDGTAWSPTGLVLRFERRGHAAFTTTTGEVFALGGVLITGSQTSAIEHITGNDVEFVPFIAADRVTQHAMVSIPGSVLVFGGISPNNMLDSAQTLELVDHGWILHNPAISPDARHGHAMAYDAKRRRVVLFGGSPTSDNTLFDDTWTWDGSTWERFDVSRPPRRFHAMAYDAKRERVVLFGGIDNLAIPNHVVGTTWTWDGATWTDVTPVDSPSPRAKMAMAYDPIRERIVMFGGRDQNANLPYDDTWLWDGATWTHDESQPRPPGREAASLAWHPSRGRLVLFTGRGAMGSFDHDLWEWSGARWSEIQSVQPATAEEYAPAVSTGTGVAAYGGNSANYADGILQELQWTSSHPAEACRRPMADLDGDGLAGCADPDCWWICTPLCPPFTTCDATAGPRCGDGTCDAYENCRSCASDCGACAPICGDFLCEGTESSTCPGDCF